MRSLCKYAGAGVALLLMLMAGSCTQQPTASAPGGAPPVRVPVGPVPGPGKETIQMPVNPYTGNNVARERGRQLFVWYNCYGCHGGHGGGGIGPSLRDKRWRYGGDDAHIFASIAEGRGKGMPAWGTKLPDDDIWKLVTYIQSLRTPDEPDAPQAPPEPKVKTGD